MVQSMRYRKASKFSVVAFLSCKVAEWRVFRHRKKLKFGTPNIAVIILK